MEFKFDGCEALQPESMQQINGGAYISNIVTLVKVAYGLTKGFANTIPLVGSLATSLLTSFVDPVVDAA